MRKRSADFLSFVLDVLFPGRCLLCGEWLLFDGKPGAQVCGSCIGKLTPLSGMRCRVCGIPLISERETCTRCRETDFAFERHLSVFSYAGRIKDLIGLYKFSGQIRLSSLFASFLASMLEEQDLQGAGIVPVPPRPRQPKPDHVERIVRALAADHGFHVIRALERTTVISQKSLSFKERRENITNGMRLAKYCEVPDKAVLLDDVFTTGATADACARILRGAGCASVSAVTLAIDM